MPKSNSDIEKEFENVKDFFDEQMPKIMQDIDLQSAITIYFGVKLPISGGFGQNIDDPIVIDVNEDGVHIEYQIIGFIQQLGGKSWKTAKQELLQKGDHWIDKVSIVLDEDPEHYHSYYFDITKFYGKHGQ